MVFDRAIAKGNWKRPLDLSLPSTYQGELHVPFSRHVRQLNRIPSDTSFPQYAHLPVELQLRVLYFCDQPTMFQLMHTSRQARTEARKLFFSNLDTWYHVEASWLLSGGHAGCTTYDIDFLTHVEQIYLDFDWMNERTWMNDEGLDHWVGKEDDAIATGYGGMHERMQDFWRTLQQRLPRVKHVILGDDHDRSDYHDGRLPPDVYQKVGQMCPPGISVSVDLVQGDGSTKSRLKRVRWQLVTVKEDVSTNASQEWKLCSNRNETSIIPPNKVFSGPVGAFLEYFTRGKDVNCQRRAIRIHRIAATEKLHFDRCYEPFSCTAPDCNVHFTQPEEYTTHVIRTKHDKHYALPEYVETLFTENDERLKRLSEINDEGEQTFLEWWSEYGSEKRCAAEKEFTHQLEHDPLYAQDKPVSEHKMLKMVYACIDQVY